MSYPFIPTARPPAITDPTLATLTQLAQDAQHGNCSSAEAEWVLLSAAGLFRELQQRRVAMAAASLPLEGNVVALPAVR